MSSLTSSLIIKLIDDVSGPAGKAAGALRGVGAAGGDLRKLAAASPDAARLVRELERLQATAGKIGQFKLASRGLGDLGLNLRKAKQDVVHTAAALAEAQRSVDALAAVKKADPAAYAALKTGGQLDAAEKVLRSAKRAHSAAAKALPRAEHAFIEQGATVRALRRDLDGLNVPLKGLRAAEAGIAAEIARTNAELERQPQIQAAAAVARKDAADQAQAQLRSAVEAGAAARTERERREALVARSAAEAARGAGARPDVAARSVSALDTAREAHARARAAAADPGVPTERMAAGTRAATKFNAILAERAKLLEDTGRISEFRIESRGLKEASLAHRKAQQDVRQLSAAIRSGGDPTGELSAKLAQAHREVVRTAEAFRASGSAVKAARAGLSSAGIAVSSLGRQERELAQSVQAATAALQRQHAVAAKAPKPWGSRVADTVSAIGERRRSGMGGGLGGGVVGGIGAFGAVGAYKDAAAFDRRLTMIGITADASGQDVDGMRGRIRALAKETALPISGVTGGLESLVAQGRSLKEALDFLPSVARTAAASASEVDDIAKTADSVGSNFNIAGRQMQGAFDIMAAGGKAGQFELKDMARYLPSLAPAASAVGMKTTKGLADVVAMLQVIRKGTGSTEEAATSLTNIFQKLESEETTKNFKKMGVDLEAAMKKGRQEGRNLIEVFEDAALKATKGDLSQLPKLIHDQEFARGVRALMTYRGEWQKLSATLQQSSAGTVDRDLERVTVDAQAAVQRTTDAIKTLYSEAARLGDKGGVSKGLEGLAAEFGSIAEALERANAAYDKGGVSGLLSRAWDDAADRIRGNRKAWAEVKAQRAEERVAEVEKERDERRRKLERDGRSPEIIAHEMRLHDAIVEGARKRAAAAKAALEGPAFAEKKPLRMGVDPTAPIQGTPGPVSPGVSAFQQAYPLDLTPARPMPAQVPLPPPRPASLPRTIASIADVLGPEPTAPPQRPVPVAGAEPTPSRAEPELPARPVPLPPPRPASLPRTIASIADTIAPEPATPVVQPGKPLPARQPEQFGGLPMPEAPDAGKIAAATQALAAYRSELAGIKAEMEATASLDLPGVGTGLESRKAELERLITDTQAKLQALGAETIAPRADASGLAPLGTAADEASTKLAALDGVTVAPRGDASGIRAITVEANAAADALQRVISLSGSAKTSIGRVNAASASGGTGNGQSTGVVRRAMANNFA